MLITLLLPEIIHDHDQCLETNSLDNAKPVKTFIDDKNIGGRLAWRTEICFLHEYSQASFTSR